MRLRFILIGLIAIVGFSVAAQTVHACTNPSPLPAGFATPCPVFDAEPTSTSQSGSITVTANPGANQYISQTFYLYNGSTWTPYMFQGSFVQGYSTSTATYTLSYVVLGSLPTGTIYLSEWDWTYNASQNCFTGPGSTSCNQGNWRAQEFALTQGQQGQCGPPNYCGYTGTDIVQPPSPIPNLGNLTKNNQTVYDTSYESHGEPAADLSPIVRCTDINTAPGTGDLSYTAGLGGSGSGILWNTNSTLLHVNGSNGSGYILQFNPSTMECGQSIANPGPGWFSTSNPDIFYSYPGTQIAPYNINPSTGSYTIESPIVDFSYGLPTASNTPPWQANHSYQFGDMVSYALSTSTQAPDWKAKTTYNSGDIIVPNKTVNPLGCAYKNFTGGTSGTSTPQWSTRVCGDVFVADGGVKQMWKGLGGQAIFYYQLTNGSGQSGQNPPAFVPASGHPDILTTVSDNGLTWTNIGPAMNPQYAWGSSGGVSADGTKMSSAYSMDSYGYQGNYTKWNGDQDTGIFDVSYDAVANIYHLFNTGTGIMTDYVCSTGQSGGYDCANGTFQQNPLGQIISSCRFFLHNNKASYTGEYDVITTQDLINGNGPGHCHYGIWQPNAPFNPVTAYQSIPFGLNHWGPGTNYIIAATNIGNGLSGTYMVKALFSEPSSTTVTWQYSNCDPSKKGPWPYPPCDNSIYDSHVSWAYNPNGDDNSPTCFSMYGLAVGVDTGPVSQTPWQNEEMCATTNTSNLQYRFSHSFSTETNTNFDAQFTISQMSQDGRFLAWTTDMAPTSTTDSGSFGSTSGATTCNGGFPWQPSYAYTLNEMIVPVQDLDGGGAAYDTYQATKVTGPSGVNNPWGNTTSSPATVQDGGVTWTNVGAPNCRADVLIVGLK